MLSANRYKIRAAAKAGKRTAKALDALLSKPDSWLGANLVVLALASVAASVDRHLASAAHRHTNMPSS